MFESFAWMEAPFERRSSMRAGLPVLRQNVPILSDPNHGDAYLVPYMLVGTVGGTSILSPLAPVLARQTP